jgi:hypothetical protein
MPNYDVAQPAAVAQQWNLQVGPIGPPATLPPAHLVVNGPLHQVPMGQQANVALNPGCTGIYTTNLTDCSAFCVLYRPAGQGWNRASLIHMMGGPDPNSVNWPGMVANMPGAPGAVYFAVLANSRPTVLTNGFLVAVAANLPQIPAGNTWVYNNQVMAINFGVDWGAFAGQ